MAQYQAGDISTDIDVDNYENNNEETFAGCYAGIIQRIRSISQRSIIFVVSMPNNSINAQRFNRVIEEMPNLFNKVYLIDLQPLSTLYETENFKNKYFMNGHLNAMGYLFTAYMFMHYIDCIIQKNPSIFKDIALWNTNYTAQAT